MDQDQGNSEALEFLGDSILGFVVTSFIFYCLGADSSKDVEPDHLHLLKAAIVKNDTLAFMAVCHGLHRSLLYSSVSLGKLIHSFSEARPSIFRPCIASEPAIGCTADRSTQHERFKWCAIACRRWTR